MRALAVPIGGPGDFPRASGSDRWASRANGTAFQPSSSLRSAGSVAWPICLRWGCFSDRPRRAIRSLLHREMHGRISPRSAQMALERLVPKLEPAHIQPTIRLDDAPDPLTLGSYDDAMGAACRAMCEGRRDRSAAMSSSGRIKGVAGRRIRAPLQ